jgi:hypothetical protein
MLSNALAFLVYAVRSVGLLIVGLSSIAAAWFSVFGAKPSMASAAKAWRRDPPTDKQLEYAVKLGIDIPDGCSKGQLSDMISAAKSARGSF